MMNHVRSFCSQMFIPSGLSPQQLQRLAEHKYSAQDVSFLDELCMKRFWDWVVSHVPLWVAPNLITIVGLVFNLSATLLLAYYSPDGRQPAPWWTYLFCAVSLFVYQTLDAIDGKQARRTGSASPLGELFDHGCDSLSQILITLQTALALQLGREPHWLVFTVVCSLFLFYAAHWQTYVCGTLRFTRFDVTEAQLMVILLSLLTAVLGSDTWQTVILGFSLAKWFVMGSTLLFFVQCYEYLSVVLTGGVGRNGSTVADTSVIFPIIPISIPLTAYLMICRQSVEPSDFDSHIVLYSMLFGIVASKVTNGLVVAHMSRSEMATWDPILVGPLILALNQYMAGVEGALVQEYCLLWVVVVLCAIYYTLYSYVVVTQLCNHLRIACFTIPHKQGD